MSVLGHVAVGVVVARAITGPDAPPETLPRRMATFAGLALLPDIDLLLSGASYGAGPLDHRGVTHSLMFALWVGLIVGLGLALAGDGHPIRWGLLAGALVASHGVMDAFGQSTLGVELFWPLSDVRVLAPWHVLPNPSIAPPLAVHFWGVLAVEALVFLPAWVYAFLPRAWIAPRQAAGRG